MGGPKSEVELVWQPMTQPTCVEKLKCQDLQNVRLQKCGDCGVKEGEYHKTSCDQERCRSCKGQTLSCSCTVEAINKAGGRYPFVLFPQHCARCLKRWPELFMVPDSEWAHYMGPEGRRVICFECYRLIQGWIDKLESEFFSSEG